MDDPLKKRLDEFWEQQADAYFDGKETGVPDDVLSLMFAMTDYIDELEARVKEMNDA